MEISLHGCNFPSFFTGVSYFSRVGSEIFSRVVPSFHGCKTENFHGLAHFFHGKKKYWGGGVERANIRWVGLELLSLNPLATSYPHGYKRNLSKNDPQKIELTFNFTKEIAIKNVSSILQEKSFENFFVFQQRGDF